MEHNIFLQLGIALLLGLLIGLQRERTATTVAGIRTFPLIAVFGALCGLLARQYTAWIVAVGMLAVAALFVIGHIARRQSEHEEPGLTTEFAGLLLYGVGVCTVSGAVPVAVATAGALVILLQFKKPLHEFVATIGEADIRAVMQFVLITAVILPVLPNQNYGPFAVLNPFKIWLMVVLIVGISLCGYVAYKLFGQRAGTLLGGLLGGLISSTATTVSYSRRTASTSGPAPLAALVIMIASTMVFVRVLIEVGAVAGGHFGQLAPPLATMLGACALIAAGMFLFARDTPAEMPEQGNPAELKSALLFGSLYAIVIIAVAAAKQNFGSRGLYGVAVLSGLTDMDAITVSTAQLVSQRRLQPDTGWRVILVASMANLVFKTGIAAVLGGRALLKWIAALFGLALAAGLLILWLWPAVLPPT